MNLYVILFYFFAAITILSAFIVVFSRNIVHSAFSLMFTFVGVVALYVLLYADFVAVTQLLVYVGGILILLVFGVMLTTRIFSVELKTGALKVLPATILTAMIAGTLCFVYFITDWGEGIEPDWDTTVYAIGSMLVNEFILPFQVAGVILLIAMIGAVMMAARDREKGGNE